MVAPKVIEIELPSGETVFAEVRALGSSTSDVGALPRFKLQDTTLALGEIARWLVDSVVEKLPRSPEKVGLDFGVKFMLKSGKLTSVLAEASGEASATIRLEWTKPEEIPTPTDGV